MGDYCKNCKHYEPSSTFKGHCRKEPPRVIPVTSDDIMYVTVWPIVVHDDWCGQWQPDTRGKAGRT